MSVPSESQAIAVSVMAASAIDSAPATTMAVRRSLSEPCSGGIGGGGIKGMNDAACRSLALEKCRHNVALATLALRVTASMVTALGPVSHRGRQPQNHPIQGACRPWSTASSSPTRISMAPGSAEHELGRPVSDHHDGRVRAAAGDRRHDRPIHHPQSIDTAHAAPRIQRRRLLVDPHGYRPAKVL